MKIGILALIEAKPDKASAVAELLDGAAALARQEANTVTWYAFRAGPTSFGVFDTFDNENGRRAHLEGQIANALMSQADELLAKPPELRMIDLISVK
jgi:quinol monooxygenase YgiN